MKPNELIVGIDSGGTSTRLVAIDAGNGDVVAATRGASARGDGLPAIADLLSPERARSVRSVCAGITKISRAGVRERWESGLRECFPNVVAVAVEPDYVIAFHGATGGTGIAVIAGTGSVVYGENAAGTGVRVGGRGWEFGDEGSGTWLTTEMIRRTLRALDGLAAPTPLTDAVCDQLETGEPAALAEAARRAAEAEGRGFLVPLALERARAGDTEAANLFVGAAGWLALQVRGAATRLGFGEADAFPVATVGGMWEAGALIREPFASVLRRWLPHAGVIAPRAEPVRGAVDRASAALVRVR